MITQEFNKVTTTSNFIKNLLISTYLPLIRTVRDFDYIVADRLYIYKCEVIKCLKSGYILTGYQHFNFKGERAQFRVVSEYYFGERNDKLCTNYISNSEGYDTMTHERLGKYLRSLRDMYDLNLMPLYNCFSNNILQAHHIDDDKVVKTSTNYNTKVYKVPIRFNTDYTICMENLGMTTFAPAFIKNNNLMKVNNTRFGNDTDVTNKYIKLYQTGVITHRTAMRFKDPIKIRYNNIPHTRTSTYEVTSYVKVDFLHNSDYYEVYDSSMNTRSSYYFRNLGTYDKVTITQSDYNANPTLYYYNNDGIMTQCSSELSYNSSTVYYVFSSSEGFTYLKTSQNQDTEHPTSTLYVGVDPSSGRLDSSYLSDRQGFWIDPETGELKQDVFSLEYNDPELDATLDPELEGVAAFSYSDRELFLTIASDRIYDTPSIETVTFWRACTEADEFNLGETYYALIIEEISEEDKASEFVIWNYKEMQEEEDFEENKTDFFYYPEGSVQPVRCSSADEYDPETNYFREYGGDYIPDEEYYFIEHKSSLYIIEADEFNADPTKYFKVEDSTLVLCTVGEVYDPNITYVRIKNMYTPSWLILNPNWDGEDPSTQFIPTTDRSIEENKTYYSPILSYEEKSYVYDITEENCALYDFCEDNLYMLIQVPKDYESSIVIIEGDYTNTKSNKIIDSNSIDLLPKPMVDYLYTENLRLMQMGSSRIKPFSDALIEFLTWNAINNLDSINNNMDRLLLALRNVTNDLRLEARFANYWYPQYRQIVFNLIRDSRNIPVTDNLGYVTREVEQVIGTLRGADIYVYDIADVIEAQEIEGRS